MRSMDQKREDQTEALLERHRRAGDASNRLIDEKSPYLLQHAFNPVEWYPWGDEAFERARRDVPGSGPRDPKAAPGTILRPPEEAKNIRRNRVPG